MDALALRAEERRDKLRKAAGSGKYTSIRRYLNGETRQESLLSFLSKYIAQEREPGELKHLSSRRKRKQHVILEVAASETERAQTDVRACRGSDCKRDLPTVVERSWKDRPERVKAP